MVAALTEESSSAFSRLKIGDTFLAILKLLPKSLYLGHAVPPGSR
jgi:hypothetical protein